MKAWIATKTTIVDGSYVPEGKEVVKPDGWLPPMKPKRKETAKFRPKDGKWPTLKDEGSQKKGAGDNQGNKGGGK